MRKISTNAFILSFSAAVCFQQAASAQTVQLPTISNFSYSGSVLVPDRGSTSLGGVSRSAIGRSSRGIGNRAFGAEFGNAAARAHVTIIDHDAIDRQIRGLPPRGRRTVQKTVKRTRPVAKTSRPSTSWNAGPNTGPGKIVRPSIADPDVEGKALVRFARKQFLAGKKSSSFEAYRLAIQTLSPKLSELAMAEFYRVFPTEHARVNVQPNRLATDPRAAEIAK